MKTVALHKNRERIARGAEVPLLLNGDHLTVPEFERRYEALQGDCKAELIEGIVVVSPGSKSGPVAINHGKAHSLTNYLLSHYAAATPGVSSAIGASLRLDGCNEYQPDMILWIENGSLAKTKVGPHGILEGRPELVVEVTLSSDAYDLHEKKAVYERNQIQEYIIWEMVNEPRFHWYALENGEYVSVKGRRAPHSMVACSRVFPGLWLDWPSLIVGQGADKGIFRALKKGLNSPEHKAFVKKLIASSTAKKAQRPKYLRITEAKYVSGYRIHLEFNDGAARVMDFGPFLRKARNPEITQYRQMRKFKSFQLHDGDLMWGDYEMIFPISDLHRGEI